MPKVPFYSDSGYTISGFTTTSPYTSTTIFDDLVQLVVAGIKRPDKVERIKDLLVEGATYCHRVEEWNRDKATAEIDFDVARGSFSVLISSIPRRRRILSIFPMAGDLPDVRYPLAKATPLGIPEVPHYYYEMGDMLNGECGVLSNKLQLFYLSYPQIGKTNETFTTWIAYEYPDVLVYYALWKLAGELALKEQSTWQQQFTMHLKNLQQNYI